MSRRISRREFVRRSAGWTALLVAGCGSRGSVGEVVAEDVRADDVAAPDPASPIDLAPEFENVATPDLLAFHREFAGDDWRRPHSVLIDPDSVLRDLPGGRLPDPDERVPVVVVGGGLAGLATSYLLRDLRPVLLEQARRLGGNSKGERWRSSTYAIGGAYFIRPEEGDAFDRLYREIGLIGRCRRLEVPDPVEFHGRIYRRFFDGEASPGDEAAYRQFRAQMARHGDSAYPEIPILGDEDRRLVTDLDRRSLRDEVTAWCGGRVPEALRAALQNYCYSSMGGGWQEVSAAGAINFLAGEEAGLLAAPGGNGALAQALRDAVVRAGAGAGLRSGCLAFRVERAGDGVRTAYVDAAGRVRVVASRAAVLACPKFVAKHVLTEMDADREAAIDALQWRGYAVVNVLVRRGIEDDFYDMYLLRDGAVLETGDATTRATDVIQGNWAAHPDSPRDHSVLTLYWPFPYTAAREQVLYRRDAWEHLRPQVERQVLEICGLLGVGVADVEQVRMTRWGHAVPLSSVGFIAGGHAEAVRRPIDERIFFVNQDNWALPAVETCLQEAFTFAPRIRAAVS